MTLRFDLTQLPELDSLEVEWTDKLLAALREGDPDKLPLGVVDTEDEPPGWNTVLATEDDT